MDLTRSRSAEGLVCEACGQLPHPHRLRLAKAKVLAALPPEVGLHATSLRERRSRRRSHGSRSRCLLR
jgi:hypothetical protein